LIVHKDFSLMIGKVSKFSIFTQSCSLCWRDISILYIQELVVMQRSITELWSSVGSDTGSIPARAQRAYSPFFAAARCYIGLKIVCNPSIHKTLSLLVLSSELPAVVPPYHSCLITDGKVSLVMQ
jgi:hypothetical protein